MLDKENPLELGPFLVNANGDQYLFPVNRKSFQSRSAENVYQEFFGRDFFKENNFYLIVGTDSGLLVNYFQQTGIPEGSRIVFLELPEVMERLPEVIDFSNINPSIGVATLENLREIFEEFRLIDYIYANRASILKSLSVIDGFLRQYFDLFVKIKTELEEAIFTTRSNLGDSRFIVRQLEALPENRVSSECLRDVFKGKTAVLLAVGPSLEEILPWVKENRDHIIIFAVSRACRKLHTEGVVPHIIYTLDPSDLSFDVSREALHFFKDSILIHANHATPLLSGQWRGRNLFFGQRVPWNTEINIPTLSVAGPTVTQGMLLSAIEMGFSRVILGGVDLCFSRKGHIYSSSVMGHERGRVLGDIPEGVETNGGWRAGTFHPYLIGARHMERLARLAKVKGCHVINMAAGAIKLSGIDFVPLEKIKLDVEDDPAEIVFCRTIPPDGRAERLAHYRGSLLELRRIHRKVKTISSLSSVALRVNWKMFQGAKEPVIYKNRMDRIEKRINLMSDAAGLLKRFGVMRFLKIVEPNQDTWSEERMERTARFYYEAFVETADEILPLLENAMERLEIRILEEKLTPDFDKMANLWERDRQFGRCLVWSNRNSNGFEKLTETELRRYNQLSRRFSKIMSLEENLSRETVTPLTDYRDLRAKAHLAFRQEHVEGLEVLIESLKEKKEPMAPVLGALAKGFCSEIDADIEEALKCYQEVIDSGFPVFTEDALTRVAALASKQNDYATVLLAFECLARISQVYAPKYAELLWVLGEQKEALNICADYLEKIPGDLAMFMRLARYYTELEAFDAARLVLEEVLERDPDHVLARDMLKKMGETLKTGKKGKTV